VVVVVRTDLRLYEHLLENEHWHLPASNRHAACPSHDPMGVPYQHPDIQRILFFALHIPVLAWYVLPFRYEICCRC
jgi:hypothetical protein